MTAYTTLRELLRNFDNCNDSAAQRLRQFILANGVPPHCAQTDQYGRVHFSDTDAIANTALKHIFGDRYDTEQRCLTS